MERPRRRWRIPVWTAKPAARGVLRYIALGVPTGRIARDVGRGLKAAAKYRTTLMRRLELRSAAAVTRFAVEHRLVGRLELD